MEKWIPSRYRQAALLAVVVVVMQVVRLAVLDLVIPDFVRGGRTFLIQHVPNRSATAQEFMATDPGLASIHLDADVSGSTHGYVDATLYEIWNAGDREVRRAAIDLSASREDCCTIRFAPLDNSRGREYRLTLQTRDFDSTQRVAFAARPVREEGGLTLNGQVQQANLVLDADDVRLARMKGARGVDLWLAMACFAVVDAAIAYALYALWRPTTSSHEVADASHAVDA